MNLYNNKNGLYKIKGIKCKSSPLICSGCHCAAAHLYKQLAINLSVFRKSMNLSNHWYTVAVFCLFVLCELSEHRPIILPTKPSESMGQTNHGYISAGSTRWYIKMRCLTQVPYGKKWSKLRGVCLWKINPVSLILHYVKHSAWCNWVSKLTKPMLTSASSVSKGIWEVMYPVAILVWYIEITWNNLLFVQKYWILWFIV